VVDPDFDRELDRLRAIYRVKLRGELETLAEMLRETRTGPSETKLAEARALAHRLKGTAGTYGLDESCSALIVIECQLENLPGTRTGDPAAAWAIVERALGKALAGIA